MLTIVVVPILTGRASVIHRMGRICRTERAFLLRALSHLAPAMTPVTQRTGIKQEVRSVCSSTTPRGLFLHRRRRRNRGTEKKKTIRADRGRSAAKRRRPRHQSGEGLILAPALIGRTDARADKSSSRYGAVRLCGGPLLRALPSH